MRLRLALQSLLLLFISFNARADIDMVSVIWQNDLLLGNDGGGYTNGAYLSLYDLSDDGGDFSPPWITRPLLGWLMKKDGERLEVSTHMFGQSMITPDDISKPVPDSEDAPYAGLLFWRAGYITQDYDSADSVTVTLGMVGPSAGAEHTQRWVHKMTSSTEPKGWDYQIKDEPVGQIERARVWRFGEPPRGDLEADLLLLTHASLGNLESAVGAAVISRYGTALRESFATATQITGRVSNPMDVDGGWNVYLGFGASYVYNQIFISGSGIRSGPEASLRRDQYAVYVGASYSWDRLSISGSFVGTTELDQASTARQRYGSLILAWRL